MKYGDVQIGNIYTIDKRDGRGRVRLGEEGLAALLPGDSRPIIYDTTWENIEGQPVKVVEKPVPGVFHFLSQVGNVKVCFLDEPSKIFSLSVYFLKQPSDCVCTLTRLMLRGCNCGGN